MAISSSSSKDLSTPMPTVSTLLRKTNRAIDAEIETAITFAEVLNIYTNALKRVVGRSTLGPDDSIRILHIVNQIMDACDGKGDEVFAPPQHASNGQQ